eukprot:GHVO01054213.1.p1 GENE.GHVO01054213.1~~GHVO01054213.1.p1  ORF type:complete len:117 (+),score=10.36 GHVO01054213.1:347-697(+)
MHSLYPYSIHYCVMLYHTTPISISIGASYSPYHSYRIHLIHISIIQPIFTAVSAHIQCCMIKPISTAVSYTLYQGMLIHDDMTNPTVSHNPTKAVREQGRLPLLGPGRDWVCHMTL